MLSRTGEVDMPGVPPNPLPIWRHLPLNYKLPMPTVVPRGAVELYTGHIGEEIWKRDDCLDFDLWDPNLYQLPAPQEYNSLKDPNLRAYLSNERIHKRLIRHGLITREGGVLCRLEDFNRYRRYLHNFNLNVIKTHEHDSEAQEVKDMMFSTLGRVQKQRADALNNKQDFSLQRVRYSSVLLTEASKIRKTTDPEFESSNLMKTATEGERRSLNICRNMIQEDFRKTALIRLRRLQDYDDRQLRGLNDWRKRRVAQVEWLAEEKLRTEQLEQERLKHIQEHIELSSCQKQHMDELIRRYAAKRYHDMREATLKMSRRICIKMHRQWPLSVRCPPNVLHEYESAIDEDATKSETIPMESELPTVEPTPAFSPANANINAYIHKQVITPAIQQYEKEKLGTSSSEGEAKPSASMTTTLTEHIVQNAITLLSKYSKSPAYGRKQVASMMDSVSKATSAQRKGSARPSSSQNFVAYVAKEVKQEMRNLVQESPDVLLLIANTLNRTQDGQPLSGSGQVDWDHAPVMRSSSSSFTGQYVRETMLEVAGQMAEEGLIPAPLVKGDVDDRVADAIMDLSLKTTTDDLQNNLVNGKEMVELAGKILRSHRATGLPGEGGEDAEELSVCLITSLIRTALLKFKDAMMQGKLKDEDLIGLASSLDMTCFIQAVIENAVTKEKLQAKVDEYGREMMTDDSIERIITETVSQINNAKTEILDEEIKSHISDAAKRFIEKIINSVFEDIDPQPKLRSVKAPMKVSKRKKICLRPGNKSNNSNMWLKTDINNNNAGCASSEEKLLDNYPITCPPEQEMINSSRGLSTMQSGNLSSFTGDESVKVCTSVRDRKFRNLCFNNHNVELLSRGLMMAPSRPQNSTRCKKPHSQKAGHPLAEVTPLKLGDSEDQETARVFITAYDVGKDVDEDIRIVKEKSLRNATSGLLTQDSRDQHSSDRLASMRQSQSENENQTA